MPLGWRPAFLSEIDPFPCAVLEQRHPGVPNLGDMTKFKEWPDAAIDVLAGGTPCQSYSVAGLRAGLDDPRGDLMLTFAGVARRYRPRWLVWENVPGVLSSGGGRDFGTLLAVLSGRAIECPASGWQNSGIVPGIEGAYGLAWRVLDAQYFGVPQRRRRVFVVGCLGDWRGAAAVLLECSSLRGDPAPRRTKRKGTPAAVEGDARAGVQNGVVKACRASDGGIDREDSNTLAVLGEDVSYPVLTKWSKGSGGPAGDEVQNLTVAFDTTQITHPENRSNPQPDAPCHQLSAGAHPPAIAFAEVADPVAANQARTYTREGSHNFRVSNVAHDAAQVRRLTPRECERLQGFSDDYTLIEYRGKPAADGPRYKALGNSMAVPVMTWIGKRIEMVDRIAR